MDVIAQQRRLPCDTIEIAAVSLGRGTGPTRQSVGNEYRIEFVEMTQGGGDSGTDQRLAGLHAETASAWHARQGR